VAYIDLQRTPTSKLLVGVRCRIANLEYTEDALLDTACSCTVLSADLMDELAGSIGAPLEAVSLDTRLGVFSGHKYRLPIELVADVGESLSLEATVAVLADWPGPTVLGFHGFLDRIRLALDPGKASTDDPRVFFGMP
jgi:hypothetical protein